MTKQTSSTQTGGTEDTDNPGGMFADKGSPQNGRSRDWIEGAGMGGTPAQEQADKRGKAGRGMVDKDGAIEGNPGTPSQ
ncbi:hypothetical protein Rumeso_03818 [Rubellimicrobium mesophilum DSM 19309]|uniref:Uncharacterized protein n=1 Tax=Rubellimicrobium mesophilum DSM 19309 TaxID=442562 RepID=A0A017HJ70_9RHOB|nr:hypothetical protein [Rubellimicrobium mesophilum]EYD74522.1 hypothetical protein Rumeso_03818 [Rubellimicrobium mesophilum DSM 19309]